MRRILAFVLVLVTLAGCPSPESDRKCIDTRSGKQIKCPVHGPDWSR